MNFTNAVYFLSTLNPKYMRSMMMAILSIGFNVNPECWLKFPSICLGCQFELMKTELKHTEYNGDFTILSDVCLMIRGLKNEGEVVAVDDATFLNDLKHSVEYDPFLRPSFPYQPDVVNVGFQLMSIENLDLTDASFKIDFFLNQQWTDKRLKHNYPGVLDASNLGVSIWRPDSYFVQSKKENYNPAIQQGMIIKIKENGNVCYGSRMAIEVSCPMDLHEFPMDVQKCALELESYGFMYDELLYNWSMVSISVNNLEGSLKALSQYDLKPVVITHGISHYVLGNWSKLRMEFVFVRNSIIFIPAMYFPCAITVFISWITFLLDVDHYPARTYLCVTSLLTIVTLQAAINASLPWVSYVKAIDKYVMMCILFIAGAFLEYACVLYIRSKKHVGVSNKQNISPPQISDAKKLSLLPGTNYYHHGYKRKKVRRRQNTPWRSQIGLDKKLHKKDHITLTKYEKFIRFYLNEGWPKKLDVFSRVFFPMSFIAFNAFYWVSSGDVQ